MSSPYRHAVAALRERHEEVARVLGETDDALAKLTTERMRLRIELDALENRLAVVRRSAAFDASPVGSSARIHASRGLTVFAVTLALELVATLGIAMVNAPGSPKRPVWDCRITEMSPNAASAGGLANARPNDCATRDIPDTSTRGHA